MDRRYLIVGVTAVAVIILLVIAIAMFSGGSIEGAGAAAAAAAAAAVAAAKANRDTSRTEIDKIALDASNSKEQLEDIRSDHDENGAAVDRDVVNTSLSDLVDEENRRT